MPKKDQCKALMTSFFSSMTAYGLDAVKSESDVGKVVLLNEDDLTQNISLVSEHDFGVEEITKVLRIYSPNLKKICVIGINVKNLQPSVIQLSNELISKIKEIKSGVLDYLINISLEN
jgi:hydrogenase maturation protease